MLSDSGKVFWTVLYCLEQKVGVTLAGLQQNGWQYFLRYGNRLCINIERGKS